MASMFRKLAGKLGRWLARRKEPVPPKVKPRHPSKVTVGGHRGIAAGDVKNRREKIKQASRPSQSEALARLRILHLDLEKIIVAIRHAERPGQRYYDHKEVLQLRTERANLEQQIQKLRAGLRAGPSLPHDVPFSGSHLFGIGATAFTPEELAKWRKLGIKDVEDFVYGGELLIVNSSNVAAMQYWIDDRLLMVEYLGKNGKPSSAYLYQNVSETEAISAAEYPSKGSFVWNFLRVRGSKTGHKKPYSRLR